MGSFAQLGGMVVNRIGSEQQRREFDLESKAFKKEANLLTEEGLRDIEREQLEGEKFEARQRLSFLNSGVSLRGSPLLVGQETREELGKRKEASTRRVFSQRKRLRQEARKSRSKGRATVIQTTSQNLGTLSKMGKGGK